MNLGIGLAQEGKKVLLIDADPQGSLTISLAKSLENHLIQLNNERGRATIIYRCQSRQLI